MNKIILLAAALAALPAHATELRCVGSYDLLHNRPDGDADAISVHFSLPGNLSVGHTLADGRHFDRAVQYDAAVVSPEMLAQIRTKNKSVVTQWSGLSRAKPWLRMYGAVYYSDKSGYRYGEWIYDAKANRQTTSVVTECMLVEAPAAPAPAAPPPVASAGPGFSVPLFSDYANSVQVNVLLGASYPARMLVDTGANVSTVNEKVALALLNAGEAEVLGQGRVGLADGSTVDQYKINVHSLTLAGGHTLTNVSMVVTKDNAAMLFGFDLLSRFGRFSIDAANHRLTFN